MRDAPSWALEGADWPLREHSTFVHVAGLRWHVQRYGTGPQLLLVHGTGASTHSWAPLAPWLSQHYEIIAPDLPGHGFTERPAYDRLSLPGMTRGLRALLTAMNARPVFAAGHSAGAAILVQACLDGWLVPDRLFSLNGSLQALAGMRHPMLAPLTRLAVCNPLLPRLLAARARDGSAMTKLLEQTGSSLADFDAERYRMLARFPRHVGAALGMMAHWDVRSLEHDLSRLATPLTLIVGEHDHMIPPRSAHAVAERVPRAEVVTLPGLGHLAHEERPEAVAEIMLARMRRSSDNFA